MTTTRTPLTITHTHEAGTMIEGTARGDGTAEILKANRWRWGRTIAAWYIPNSRDRLPQEHLIARTAAALEGAGFTLAPPRIDRTARSTAEVEADKAERQAARVEALEAKAERKNAAAEQASARATAASDALPWGGEPIKVGHHSERRHRNAIDKAHRAMGRSVEAHSEAARVAMRAETAAHTTDARYAPVTVANRIEKLAADIRRVERDITGDFYDTEKGYIPATDEQKTERAERYAPRLEELRDQLAYWQQVRADQVATGQAADYSRDTVKKGDFVKIRGSWSLVVRANPKTVRVQIEPRWELNYLWANVKDHRAAVSAAASNEPN